MHVVIASRSKDEGLLNKVRQEISEFAGLDRDWFNDVRSAAWFFQSIAPYWACVGNRRVRKDYIQLVFKNIMDEESPEYANKFVSAQLPHVLLYSGLSLLMEDLNLMDQDIKGAQQKC